MYTTLQNKTNLRLPEGATLRFVRSEERYSIYTDAEGEEYLLHHSTGNVLVSLDDIDPAEEWQKFAESGYLRRRLDGTRRVAFMALWLPSRVCDNIEAINEAIAFCTDCWAVLWSDDLFATHDGYQVCESCHENYWSCVRCDQSFRSTNTVEGDDEVCDRCLNNNYSWCDPCDVWFAIENRSSHSHDGSSCCESPETSFSIRNDGKEPLANDTPVEIALAAGVISEEGMYAISTFLQQHAMNTLYHSTEFINGTVEERALMNDERGKWNRLSYELDQIGPQWQRKDGNFPKRLSRYAYKTHGLKLPPVVMSEVGNIASSHSQGATFTIAVTRMLNLPREEFAHSGSCWWSEYYESRCALKTNGGFGLRSFGGTWGDTVMGRAWVMPLRKTAHGLVPTFETLAPDAFVVFNGYGNLNGYLPARVMAHMAGMTYRKISFTCEPMYVNNEVGYLVAPEEIAEPYTDSSLNLEVDQHSNLYHYELNNEMEPAHV